MKIFVYGTLKKGFYNHDRMRMKKAKYLGKATLSGFNMYSVLFFPVIVHNGDKTKKIVGEIYDVNETDYLKIKTMERASGYKEIKIKYKNDDKLHCFIFDKIPFNSELIESGEWTKEYSDLTFNDISVNKESIKEKEVIHSQWDNWSEWNNYYSNFEDDYDTDNDIYDLLIDFPHLLYDIEIQEYITKSTRLKRMIQADNILRPIQIQLELEREHDPYKMSEKETSELDEFWDKYVEDKGGYKPDYELNQHVYCACRAVNVKPIWMWDAGIRVWRCQKCGEFQ